MCRNNDSNNNKIRVLINDPLLNLTTLKLGSSVEK